MSGKRALEVGHPGPFHVEDVEYTKLAQPHIRAGVWTRIHVLCATMLSYLADPPVGIGLAENFAGTQKGLAKKRKAAQ